MTHEQTKGATRKIADLPEPPCRHPQHDPATMIVLPDGIYEHTCPACGKTQKFTIDSPKL